MERPSSSAGRRGPRRSVAGYEHIEQTQKLMTSIIHELVQAGDIAALREELRRDQNLIECQNSEGMTPLFVAVSMGNLELVQFVATSGAKLDSKDNLGRTPIALASYQGWNDGVYYLLALGANQTMVDNCGRLPLHAATYYSNQRTVQILLKQLPIEYVNTQDCEGMTAFHWAAFHGRADLVKLLVEYGAELIARDNEGKTPLHWAAQNGSVDCCRAILNTVAGQHLLNGKDFSGKTPIHFAAAAGHVDALQELITEKFANIDLGDAEDRTPLHWAAVTGHALCALVLLRCGADKDCVDKDGASPLMYAQQRGHKLCSELIFNHDPENPLNTRLADNIVETAKPSTPPEIHIDTSPSNFSMNGKVSRNSSRNSTTTKLTDIEKTDDDDNEVQEIFSQNVEEVLVEVNNNNSEKSESLQGEGRISSLLCDLRKPSPSSSTSTSPWLLCNTMNGHHIDGDNSGFSSDDELRYPPQMVLTPIPGASPIHVEDNDQEVFENRPPVPFSRFSFEENVHAPFLKPPSTAAVLAPLRPKRVPEHLRLDVGYTSSTAKTFEFKPVTSPASEPTLAPLKISKIKQQQQPQPIKQQGLPLMQQPIPNRQLVASPTKTPRSVSGGSTQNREASSDSDFSRFWARKKKQEPVMKPSSSSSRVKLMNRSLSIPEETRSGSGSKGASGFTYGGSDLRQFDSDSEFSRKLKDKQPLSGGQILPAISNDKPNKISQGQGSFRDHIARFRRSVKKKQKNKSGVSNTDSFDDGYEENSRPAKPKEKKKIRKVMSWNT